MTEKDKTFDLKMRSLLEQAEETVPAGAWEAIRSRIPAKPVRKAAPWWWAGASLAAAAATALALVLGGTFRSTPAGVTPGEALAQAVESKAQQPSSEMQPAAETVIPETAHTAAPAARPARKTVSGIQAASTKGASPESGMETATTKGVETEGIAAQTAGDKAPVAEETTPAASQEAPAAGSTAPQTERTAPASEKQERWTDPFARMAYEDAHRKSKHKVSLQLNGLAGTNDKALANLRGGMMAAPAKVESESGQSTYITESGESSYAVPISFGLGAKFYFAERWAFGTGVNFTILNRKFPGTFTKDGSAVGATQPVIKHRVQYVGIPANLYFDLISTQRIKMYTFAGASIEKGVSQKYIIPGSEGPEYWKKQVPGVQGSAGLGAGFQMNVTDRIGVYVDPSARYYFGADQPKTIRTQQNVMFNLEFGVRFDLDD